MVTGGGSGIGEATCVRLAEDGARVAVLDIDASAAELTAKLAGGGLALVADVTDSAAVEAALADGRGAARPGRRLGQQRRHRRRRRTPSGSTRAPSSSSPSSRAAR